MRKQAEMCTHSFLGPRISQILTSIMNHWENILAVFIISFIIVVVGVLLLGLIGMIFISLRSGSSNDKKLQSNDEEKQALAEKA